MKRFLTRAFVSFALLFCAQLITGPSLAAIPFKDCPECPEMIVVPPGTFAMGSPATEGRLYANESPQHQVTIRRAFAVAVYPVTFEQWDTCYANHGCNAYFPSDQGWSRGKRPVINVSWDDAQSYIHWLNDQVPRGLNDEEQPGGTGPYRLLTEAEWEYAARAGTTTAYYWGNTHGIANANCDGCGSGWDNKQSAPVGSFAPNPFGLYDMAGNVLQWVEDCYHETYAKAPTDGSAWIAGECRARVMRGGSWYNSPYYLRSANRYSNGSFFRGVNIGFRVARTLDETTPTK